MTFSVPLAGYNSTPLPQPALDFESAQEITLSAGIEQTVSLPSGIYQMISVQSSFAFAHAPDLTGVSIRAPWFKEVWLTLYIDRAEDLALLPDSDGTLLILPARKAS